MPLSLELHFCLWNEPVSQTPMPEVRAFWERRSHRELDGLVFPSLSGVDQLAYMTLHILRNLFLRAWIIHHVRELAVFLNNHADDDAFWHSWSKIHSSRMRSIQAIAFYYARAWFNCRLHPMAAHEIDTLPANRRSWLDCFCGSALESMFRLNKDFMWLQLTLVPTMAGKWKILRRAFFPARIARIGVLPIRIEKQTNCSFARGEPLAAIHRIPLLANFRVRPLEHGHARTRLWLVRIARGFLSRGGYAQRFQRSR